MLLGKKRKLGRKLEELSVGEKLTLTEKIEDKDLLLFLGLTNDANPLYIQHDYASQTTYKRPLVPPIMLIGIITSAISKYFPGPGSHIDRQEIDFIQPVYHYAIIQFLFEITAIDEKKEQIIVQVEGVGEDEQTLLRGRLVVSPPKPLESMLGKNLENF